MKEMAAKEVPVSRCLMSQNGILSRGMHHGTGRVLSPENKTVWCALEKLILAEGCPDERDTAKEVPSIMMCSMSQNGIVQRKCTKGQAGVLSPEIKLSGVL